MKNNDIAKSIEQQFGEIIDIILQHKSNASKAVNEELLLTAWHVGGYVSAKLKSEEWGSKVVSQLSEYIRSQRPDIKGFGRSNIYNMVLFYEEYSSETFYTTIVKYLNSEFVQPITGQIEARNHTQETTVIVQPLTYAGLLGNKDNMSKGLLETYPNAPIMFKDTLFVDFLNLPKKHSESKLRSSLVEHMKQFILELGKDFIFMDQEYRLNIGTSTFKADLLFFHRGLQALVAVELKKTKFHPRDLGQLEFYLEALDRDVKRSNENPSIGIILCPEADQVVVEYAMSRSMSPTMIAEYKRILIPQERMQQQLNEFCNLFLNKD